MPVTKISEALAKTAAWKSGTTTEYFIWPRDALYAQRDFEIRVSRATVEESPSVFTSLPGYQRLLMPLTSGVRLVFEGRGEISLGPLETAAFDGGWNTTSFGKCADLGIMFCGKWQGELLALASGSYPYPAGFSFVYAVEGGGTVAAAEDGMAFSFALKAGDFVLLESETGGEIVLELEEGQKVAAGKLSRLPGG